MFTTRVLRGLTSTFECRRPCPRLLWAGKAGLSRSLRVFLNSLPEGNSSARPRPLPQGAGISRRAAVCGGELQGDYIKASFKKRAQVTKGNHRFWVTGHATNNRWRSDSGGGGDESKVSYAPLTATAVFGLSLAKFWRGDEEEKTPEEKIIHLLKQAKLCVMKNDLKTAEKKLHEALFMAEEMQHKSAIIYIYDLMANIAFLSRKLDYAETLFKATLGLMLSSGVEQDNNAVIEISLKLAAIYAMQGKDELAVLGYEWCIKLIEEKLVRQKEVTDESLSEEYKANTQLLLGMTLDSFARYLRTNGHLELALQKYTKALAISHEVQGEQHPQTVVLMCDLATTLDALGRFAEAEKFSGRASIIAEETEHPEQSIIFLNHAGVLLHQENYSLAEATYMKAMRLALKQDDPITIREIRKGLDELQKQRANGQTAEV